ncbi:MAG: metal-dependent hydrolase [Synoicihabitans sp.]
MSLIDSHTHLDSFARRGELPSILQRSAEVGVTRLITVGTASDDWTLCRDMAEQYSDQVAYTVGLHPCSVEGNWTEEVAQIAAFWRTKGLKPCALGECGLDRFHLPAKDPARAEQILAWQKAAFTEQLKLARELKFPVVVHSRGAFQECVDLIDDSGVDWTQVVFHCFAEGPAEMTILRERGGVGSFTGILTYKNAQSVRDAATVQGLEHLMLETDAPYLTPVPHRGKPNEPSYLKHTAEFAAELWGVSLEELGEITSANARRFYGVEN